MKATKVMSLVLLLLSSNIAQADRLDDILNKHSKTIGNIDAWRQIKDITYEVYGMNRPFSSENWDLTNNAWLGTTRVLELILNSPIEDSFFEMNNFHVL